MAGNNQDLGSMIINLGLDSNQFTNSLDDIKRQMKTAQSAMKAQVATFDAMGDRAGALGAKLNGLKGVYELQGKELEELRRRHQQTVATYGEHSEKAQRLAQRINRTVSQMASYQQSIQRTEQQLEDLTNATEELGNETQNTGKKLDKFTSKLDNFAEKSAGFSKACGVMLSGVGLLGGAILKVGSDFDYMYAKVENSMQGTQEEIKNAQKVSKEVFADGFGEDLNQVSDAIIAVKQNIQDLNQEDLKDISSQILMVEEMFGLDMTESTRAVSQLMKQFGLDSREAMDFLVSGAKAGLNQNGDLGDQISEYAPLYAQAGYNAGDFFDIMKRGTSSGVFQVDKVNDGIKEMGIRLSDGSKGVADAMAQMSSSTQKVWEDMKAGKATSAEVMMAVIGELEGMEDQTKATQLGVATLGTPFEDLGNKAIYALNDTDKGLKDVEGSAKKASDTLDKTFNQQIKELMRSYATELEPIAREFLTLAKDALPAVKDGIESVSDKIQGLIAWYKGLSDGGKNAVKYTALFGVGLLALGASITPIVLALSGITKGIAGTILGFKKFFGMFRKSSANIDAETNALNRNTRAHQRNNGARGGVVQGASSRNRNLQGAPRTGTIGDYHGNQAGRATGKMAKLKGMGKLGGGLAIAGGALYGGMEIYDRVKSGESTGKAVTKGVTTGVGATGGALIGGALGSFIPVVGTMVGSMAGGYIGSKLAGTATKDGGLIDKIFSSKALNVFKSDSKKINDEVAKLKKPIVMDYKIKGVSEETVKILKEYDKLNAGVKQKLNSLYMSQTKISDAQKNKLISNQRKITASVLASVDKREKDEINSIKKSSIFSEKEKAKEIERVKDKYAKKRNATNSGEARINAIISKANRENRALTKSEYEKINAINKQMNDRKISATSRGEKEATRIKRAQKDNRVGIGMQELKVTREQANKQFDAVVSRAKKTREKKIAEIKYQRDVVGSISKKEADKLISEAKRTERKTIEHAKDKRDRIVNTAKAEENRLAIVARRTREDQVSQAKKTKDGVSGWWSKLKNFMQETWNKVRTFFGFKPILTDKERGDTTAKTNTDKIGSKAGGRVSKYATGTINGSHKGGMALVNDAKGKNYQELIATPNGNMFVPQQRNVMLDLPKGSAVLSGDKTAQLLKQYNFPQYAKGSGDDSLFAKGINFGKKMWKGLESVSDKAKNLIGGGVGKVWDFFKGKLSNLGGLNAKDTFFNKSDIFGLIKNTTKGGMSKLIEAFTKFKEEEEHELDWHFSADEFEKDPNAIGAGNSPQGLMNYVYEIFKDIKSKFNVSSFGGYANRGKVGGKGKSMHAFGRAIDIFASFSEMQKIANYVKKHPLSQYTIFNNKASTRGGVWKPYGATKANGKSPHTDHVHADFLVPKAGSGGNASYSGGGTNYSGKYASTIKKYAKQYGVSPALIAGIIQQESRWNPNARSPVGAGGLMQLMPATARGLGVKNVFDPEQNIRGGTKYIAQMLKTNRGNIRLALASYNAGYGNVLKYGGIPPFAETQGYVRKVMANYQNYKSKGYSNGGYITQEHLAMVGEGNRPEMIIPLDASKRTRALDLLHKTAQKLGVNIETKQPQQAVAQNNNNDEIVRLLVEQNALLMQQNKLIKEKQLNISDEQIYNSNKRALEKKNRRDGYSRGL